MSQCYGLLWCLGMYANSIVALHNLGFHIDKKLAPFPHRVIRLDFLSIAITVKIMKELESELFNDLCGSFHSFNHSLNLKLLVYYLIDVHPLLLVNSFGAECMKSCFDAILELYNFVM